MKNRREFVMLAASALSGGAVSFLGATAFRKKINPKELEETLSNNPDILKNAVQRSNEIEIERSNSIVSSIIKKNRLRIFSSSTGKPASDYKNTIVEYMDYNCPACKAAHEEIKRDFARITVIPRQKPILGSDSLLAAKGAIASQLFGNFYTYHEALMAKKSRVTADDVFSALDLSGIYEKKAAAAINSNLTAKYLNSDNEVSKLLQIQSTPTFVLRNTLLSGYSKGSIISALNQT